MHTNDNFFIKLLSHKDRKSLLTHCELVTFSLSEILHKADKNISYVYFPVDGFISLTQKIDEDTILEIGMVGREGMLGAELMLGLMTAPFNSISQESGNAWRIDMPFFLQQAAANHKLRNKINNYLIVRIKQLALAVACQRFHSINQRLAKFLLMIQDRAKSDSFYMTQEHMASMLGVRRVSITTIASDFQRRGFINYYRGDVQVINRDALQKIACNCYTENEKIYSLLMH